MDLLGNEGFIFFCYCFIVNILVDFNFKFSILGYEDSFEESDDGIGEKMMIYDEFYFMRIEKFEINLVSYFLKRIYGL